MPNETSAGIILFKRDKEIKYLLLYKEADKNYKARWDLPKGNVDSETPLEAAKRELEEETGIKKIKLYPEFQEKNSWFYKKDNKLIHKDLILFLAEAQEINIALSYEHQDYKWVNKEDAISLLKYKNYKILFEKADKFIKNKL